MQNPLQLTASLLLGTLKRGLRPLPTVISVTSPDVLQATEGLKYSVLSGPPAGAKLILVTQETQGPPPNSCLAKFTIKMGT